MFTTSFHLLFKHRSECVLAWIYGTSVSGLFPITSAWGLWCGTLVANVSTRLIIHLQRFCINFSKVWSLAEGSCLMTLTGHHDAVTCLNLTFDSRKVISGSLDHNLKFWDLLNGKVRELNVHVMPQFDRSTVVVVLRFLGDKWLKI